MTQETWNTMSSALRVSLVTSRRPEQPLCLHLDEVKWNPFFLPLRKQSLTHSCICKSRLASLDSRGSSFMHFLLKLLSGDFLGVHTLCFRQLDHVKNKNLSSISIISVYLTPVTQICSRNKLAKSNVAECPDLPQSDAFSASRRGRVLGPASARAEQGRQWRSVLSLSRSLYVLYEIYIRVCV